MKRRTSADWQELIEKQAASGETAAAFCRARSINAKYFSSRKTRLEKEGSSFLKALIKTPPSSSMTTPSQSVTITLAGDHSAQWLAQLLRELAP